ncbi:LysM domain/BON superfamily protein [compost metagenome]
MDQLTAMMSKGEPLRLIIAGEDYKLLNALVIISAHNNTFRGGEPGDIYYDIIARTWRKPKIHSKVGTVQGKGTTGTSRSDTRKKSVTYVVKSGDNLSKIAKRELGSSSKWRAIYKQNKGVIGADPNKIKPGQKLVLLS